MAPMEELQVPSTTIFFIASLMQIGAQKELISFLSKPMGFIGTYEVGGYEVYNYEWF